MWDNLVGVWAPFLGASGKLMDWAGGNHGTLVNDPIWVPGALDFPGTDEWVDGGAVDTNDFGVELTVITNVKRRANTNNMFAFSTQHGVTALGFSLYSDNTLGYKAIVKDSGAWATAYVTSTTGYASDLNKWVSLAIVKTGGFLRLYRNGVQIGVDACTGGNIQFDGSARYGIGAISSGDSNFYNGQKSGVYIYNAALAATQIKQHYENQKGLFIPRRRVWGFTSVAAGISIPVVQHHRQQQGVA